MCRSLGAAIKFETFLVFYTCFQKSRFQFFGIIYDGVGQLFLPAIFRDTFFTSWKAWGLSVNVDYWKMLDRSSKDQSNLDVYIRSFFNKFIIYLYFGRIIYGRKRYIIKNLRISSSYITSNAWQIIDNNIWISLIVFRRRRKAFFNNNFHYRID